MRTIIAASVIFAIAMLLVGCEMFQPQISDLNVKKLKYEELRKIMADPKQKAVLVDVRMPDRFAQGHIPGAINIPTSSIVARGDPRLSEARMIIVYSKNRGGEDGFSSSGAKRLMALRYKNVVDFEDGLQKWQNEGNLIEPPTSQPAK